MITKCPYCKEIIKDHAFKCRYCNSILTTKEYEEKRPMVIKALNPAGHIGHRIVLSLLAGLMLISSLDLNRISDNDIIDEVSINLTSILCVGIYAAAILIISDENRIWVLVIIGILVSASGFYLELIFALRK